jgi:L-alanine-DL-glutamate epimerase-like enolase superfamily enzyme
MKLTAIRTRPYQFELKRPLGDVNFPEGRKLWSGLAVFLDTDEGLCGVSIGNPGSRPFIHAMGPLLIGEDPKGVRGLWKRMIDRVFKGGNRGAASDAVSCLDIALWDLKAKANDEPLWRTLGASSPLVKAYASGIDMCLSDEELKRFYEGMAERGVTAGKLKVGRDQEADIRRLGIVRDALRKATPRPEIAIDSNEFWSPKQAIRRIREMEEQFDLIWAEEPARRWDYRGLRKVSSSIRAAVATGENLDNIEDFMPLVDHGAADIIEVGAGTSGITGAMQVAHLAYAFELPVCMMNTPGNYMAHLAAALPNHMMLEVVDAGRDACFTIDNRIENGHIVLGEKAGLGLVFDEEKLEALSADTVDINKTGVPGRADRAGLS